jgi:acetyl-CoA/propionyl-CoA carboxylase biotin carboxyl carrier protein
MTSEPSGSGAITTYRVEIGDRTYSVEIAERDDGLSLRIGDGPTHRLEVAVSRDDGELSVLVGSEVLRGLVGARSDCITVVVDGHAVEARVLDERAARLASAAAGGRPRTSETAVRAPMPGLVVGVPVEAGQAVSKGTTLVVLSAMKMQNELTAPADSTVKEVLVMAGQTVDQDQVLVRLG